MRGRRRKKDIALFSFFFFFSSKCDELFSPLSVLNSGSVKIAFALNNCWHFFPLQPYLGALYLILLLHDAWRSSVNGATGLS